jgi:hypothetical protein
MPVKGRFDHGCFANAMSANKTNIEVIVYPVINLILDGRHDETPHTNGSVINITICVCVCKF